ncbi:transcriptional regulator with XRE-family HTH domain [Kitasatospora herbaricolor]|uniref:helix-turn-helix domain-containing protein n=1 Tax=Kitasatospora herbaricolor TaxID=68217 RepID=UPI00278E835C|nr:helix-turn-helix transcriptional regulator [Kitasatospora herbaricolor]MDQ0310689.1 transcriptional regulator with XRE-family HTH domain [Kitasatospora herbaricolor]
MDSPTVLRRRLGTELGKLRAASRMAAKDVAATLGWSASKLSRIESGSVPLQDRDAARLLAHYGVDDPAEVKQFINLARQSRQQGWWHAYGDALPDWFRAYIGLEADATKIETFQCELVPGLLQTEDYARQVIRAMNPGEASEDIERRVALRMERQQILDRPQPPRIWAIIGEAVMRRQVGDPSQMSGQLHHMADMAEGRPNMTIQVLPFSAGAHAAMGSSSSILSFSDLPGRVAYSEVTTISIYTERESEIARHEDTFLRLMASSVQPEKSVSWLREVAEEYK